MRALAVLTLLLLSAAPARGETWLMAGGWSYHLDRGARYNESHHVWGLRHGPYSLMRFTNSLGREAYGAGYHAALPRYRWRGIEPGLYAGLWTGYDWPATPVAGLTLRHQRGPFAMVATTAGAVSIVHLELLLQ